MSKVKIPKIIYEMAEYAHICKKISEGEGVPEGSPLNKWNEESYYTMIRRDNDFCYVSIEPTRLVFTFNPSDDLPDWLNNFNAKKNPIDIHEGFYDSCHKFFSAIDRIIAANRYKDIYVTGVSRGGALAIIAGYYIADTIGLYCEVYPIVNPMVGGKVFRKTVKRLRMHIHALHYKLDIVSKMPPKIAGYKTVGLITTLNPKWWHYLPSLAIRWAAHKSWYKNLKDQ
jgi:hypothetical protein